MFSPIKNKIESLDAFIDDLIEDQETYVKQLLLSIYSFPWNRSMKLWNYESYPRSNYVDLMETL